MMMQENSVQILTFMWKMEKKYVLLDGISPTQWTFEDIRACDGKDSHKVVFELSMFSWLVEIKGIC